MDTEYSAIEDEKQKWRYFLRQLFVCSITINFYFMVGLSLGTPTVAVPQLRREANSTSAVSEDMASWISKHLNIDFVTSLSLSDDGLPDASIVPYSATFWILVLVLAAHHFGRRKTTIIVALNALVAFAILLWSDNILHLFISQLIQGLTQGSFTTTSSMIVLEYTSPEYRGSFFGVLHATYFWGIWVANAIGIFTNFRYIGIVGITCAVYNFIALLFIPESPYWLACNKKYDECAVVHRWLKGVTEGAEKELDALINIQTSANKNTVKTKVSLLGHISKYINILGDPQIYKPIFLAFILVMNYQFCGKIVCAVYAIEIMKKFTGSLTQAYIGVLSLDGVSVAGLYLGSFLSRHYKRRKLLIGASTVCAMFLFALSLYLFLVKFGIILENFYVSILLLVGFSLAACCGPMVVSAALFAELYPIRYRSFTMCIVCVMSKICLGSAFKLAPYIFKAFLVQGAFLFFAIGFSITIVLVYKLVPETKDKTMQEISEMFKRKKINQTESELLK